jgi:hypothetical protein
VPLAGCVVLARCDPVGRRTCSCGPAWTTCKSSRRGFPRHRSAVPDELPGRGSSGRASPGRVRPKRYRGTLPLRLNQDSANSPILCITSGDSVRLAQATTARASCRSACCRGKLVMQPETGSCNDNPTICPICGPQFRRVGRQRSCDDACRQAAWRRRHPTPLPVVPARSPRPSTVYDYSACQTRSLSDQYCPECRLFCRRVGPGGRCPACDEPVALAELLSTPTGLEVLADH